MGLRFLVAMFCFSRLPPNGLAVSLLERRALYKLATEREHLAHA